MRAISPLIPCLAVALAANGIAPVSAAVHVPRDFTQPAKRSASSHVKPAFSTPGAVGSSNEATADPPVPRPNEAPCVVTLFSSTFSQYAAQTFAYAPPAGCPGPYNEIVFNGNFGVSAGIQFDRTASIEIGNAPIYFGTTAEPGSTLGPTWHVERDVTEDAALLAAPQTVEADIFNIVNSTYTGVISGTAFLQFYPAHGNLRPAKTPNLVLPFPGVAGGPQHLPTPTSTLTATYTLPRNINRAYIDLYQQSQQTDEQYFNCTPDDVATELAACPNTAFRETEVSIDGTPAGAAPIYPWIYTGGLDPYLWFPIPGVQTLQFKPYRLDLSPFAARLDNGKSHTITMSVDNADNYFQGFGTLFAYTDPRATVLHGALIRDTLNPNPTPAVHENLSGTAPAVDGTIVVSNHRGYEIAGYIDDAWGRTTTVVDSTLDFVNKQTYSNESALTGTLAVNQQTIAQTQVATYSNHGFDLERRVIAFPLNETLATVLNSVGTGTQVGTIDQHFIEARTHAGSDGFSASYASNEVTPTDTLDIFEDQSITGNSNQASSQEYVAFNTGGYCYAQTIQAAANVVTGVYNGKCAAASEEALMRGVGLSTKH